MDIGKLCIVLDRRFKKMTTPEKYDIIMRKLDKIIGVIYGSVIGLLSGAATQPLGLQSASAAFEEKFPFTMIPDKSAITDPVIGQLLIQLNEFKNCSWDPNKFKTMRNYLSVVPNSSVLKIELYPKFVEQIRCNRPPDNYNLFSEDFYLRIPFCTFFGEESLTTVIGKIMQTHTSFEASAYGIIAVTIIRKLLMEDDLLSFTEQDCKFISSNWEQFLTTKLIPIIEQYKKLYCEQIYGKQPSNEAEEKRFDSSKLLVEKAYTDLIKNLNMIESAYKVRPIVDENTDHMSDEQKNDHQIISLYNHTLDALKLNEKHSSHPAILACWTLRTIYEINDKMNLESIDISHVIQLILRSVAIRTGCSGYNCMIVGATLGAFFGFNQFPEEFYSSLDIKLMDRINKDILDIINQM